MTNTIFSKFEDGARIWIYAFNKSLSPQEVEIINRDLTSFIENWNSHGDKVSGAFQVLYDRFVILCATQESGVSGCSIDSSTRVFKKLKDEYDLDALDLNLVHYRENGQIYSRRRADVFLDPNLSLKNGTTVFDLSIQTLGELRAGNFEIPVEQSWLAHKISA